MSFIYSRALVEAFSEANCSDIDASAPSSGSHTRKPCLWHDKTMEPSRLSRFGQTCRTLTDDLGADVLTWWLEDFPVRTSALQETAQDSTANAAECGTTWRESLGKYDPDTHSLKTAQLSLIEDLTGCYVILPLWGCLLDGALYPLPTAVLPICANESGFWRTPKAQDGGARGEYKDKSKLDAYLAKGHTLDLCTQVRWNHLWPTPTVCGNHNRKGLSKTSGDGLATAVKKWPTPTAHMAKETNAPSEATRNEPRLSSLVGGRLNPQWVESYLMGWPIDHTDLKPLETDKLAVWRQQHSASYREE